MAEENLFSVSGLNEYVAGLLSVDPFLKNIRVEGELTGFKRHSSGHLYFSLKDENALVRCVMFRQQAMHLGFPPTDGMKVVLNGYATLFQRDGSFQLYARTLEKQGQGDLFRRFLELKAKLEQAGYFDEAHKKRLPFLPKCIGIITSGTGAALQDILNIVGRRFPKMNICICPVKVQGEGAAKEIAAAIRQMNAEASADVLIVGRGGGSIEDLWAFNEPEVASAIYESRVPVISAVGHETDFTIADFVADLRAPTPSAAAELAVPEYAACMENTIALRDRASRALSNDLERRRAAVRMKRMSSGFQNTARRLDEKRQHVDALREKLLGLPLEGIQSRRHTLELRMGKLESLGPLKVLSRGYAYFTNAERQPVSSVNGLSVGDTLIAHFKDGTLETSVTAVNKE